MDLSSLAGPEGWPAALESIGFTDDALAAGDERNRWLTSIERDGAELQKLTEDHVRQLSTIWPGSMTIEVLLANQVELKLNDPSAIDRLPALVSSATYTVRLSLDKAAVLSAAGTSPDAVRWYVSPQAQRAMLQMPHPRIERDWFGSESTAVVAVPHYAVHLAGPYLSVVGGEALSDVAAPAPDSRSESTFLRQRERLKNVVWEDSGFAQVVPIQLAVDGSGWSTEVGRLVAEMMARHVLLFTADRVRRGSRPGGVRGEYHGAAGAITIELPSGVPDAPETTAAHACELMAWLFTDEPGDRSWLDDRMALVRAVVFEQLRRASDAERGRAFVDSLQRLSSDAQWHWRLFISNELDGHVAAVDAFRDDVAETAESFTSATSDVIDSMIEGMKAAVATVIGSFIGAALATEFKETVFRVGMIVYAVYIVVFPGIFGLWSKYDVYRVANGTFTTVRSRAVMVLGEERVAQIEGGRTSRARKSFWTMFVLSAVVFVAVAAAALIAQAVIPAHLD